MSRFYRKSKKQNKQLGDSEKNLLELQEKLNMAKTEIDAGKKELSKTNGHSNHLSIKILALASENDVLRKPTNHYPWNLKMSNSIKLYLLFCRRFFPKNPQA